MKTCFTILFLLITGYLCGQGDRTRYTLDYSLSRTDAAGNGPAQYFDPGLAHNIFIKTELSTKRTSRFTIGAGFLQSKIISNYFDHNTGEYFEYHHSISYIVIPAGIKSTFGSFYIHPEIAAAYNYSILTNSYLLDSEMNRPKEPFDSNNSHRSFEVQFASLMNIGFEIKTRSMTVLTGAKGYFAYNNNYVNTFGIGLMVGLKI